MYVFWLPPLALTRKERLASRRCTNETRLWQRDQERELPTYRHPVPLAAVLRHLRHHLKHLNATTAVSAGRVARFADENDRDQWHELRSVPAGGVARSSLRRRSERSERRAARARRIAAGAGRPPTNGQYNTQTVRSRGHHRGIPIARAVADLNERVVADHRERREDLRRQQRQGGHNDDTDGGECETWSPRSLRARRAMTYLLDRFHEVRLSVSLGLLLLEDGHDLQRGRAAHER